MMSCVSPWVRKEWSGKSSLRRDKKKRKIREFVQINVAESNWGKHPIPPQNSLSLSPT